MAREQLQFSITVDTTEGSAALRRFVGALESIPGVAARTGHALGATGGVATRAGRDFTNFQARIISLNQAFDLAQRGARLLAHAFEASFGGVVRRARELDQFSRRLGIPVQQLSALKFAAEQAGVSLGELAPALQSLQVALAKGLKPGTDFHRFFTQELRLAREELERLSTASPNQLLLEMIARFKELAPSVAKTRAEVEVFGSRAVRAVRVLAAEELPALRRNLEELPAKFGLIMTPGQVASAKGYASALHDVRAAFEGLLNRLAATGAFDTLSTALRRAADAISQQDVERIGLALEHAVTRTVEAIPRVAAALQGFAGVLAAQITLLTTAASAWLAYRAGLLTAAVVEGVVSAFTRLRVALTGVQVALAAVRAAQVGFAGELIAVSRLTVLSRLVTGLGGPLGVVTTGLGLAAGAITYFAARAGFAKLDVDDLAKSLDTLKASLPTETFTEVDRLTRRERAKLERSRRTEEERLGLSPGSLTRGPGDLSLPEPPLRQVRDVFGEDDGKAAQKALDDFREKLRLFQQEVTAGIDPVAKFRAEVAKQADTMLGSAKVTDDARAKLEALVATNLRTQALADLSTKLQELAGDLSDLQSPADVAATATRALAADLEQKFGLSLGGLLTQLPQLPPALLAVRDAFQALKDGIARGLPDAEIAQLLGTVVEKATAVREVIRDLQTAKLFAGTERELRVFRGEITESQAAVEELTASLKDAHVTQGPRGEPIEAYAAAVVRARNETQSFFDVFAEVSRAASDVFEALILGTRSVNDAFEGLKLGIVRSFTEAFLEGFKQKLGFEGKFRINVVGFLAEIGNLISGQGGGPGGSLLGGLGQSLFGNGTGTATGGTGSLSGAGGFGLGGFGGSLASSIISLGNIVQSLGAIRSRPGADFGLIESLKNLALNLGKLATLSPAFSAFVARLPVLGSLLGPLFAPGFVGPLAGISPLASSVATGPFLENGAFAIPGVNAPLNAATGAESATGGALAGLGTLLSIVGSLFSLVQSFVGTVKTGEALKRATLNDPAANRFQTGSLVATGIGTAAGAAVGAIAGAPAAPFTFGASILLGAAIGAAIANVISTAIAGAIGKSTSEATKQGLRQQQLFDLIANDPAVTIPRGIGTVGLSATGLLGEPGSTQSLAIQALISPISALFEWLLFQVPDVELLFDKFFGQVLEKLGFPGNRQLGDRGEGVPRRVNQVTTGPTGERVVTRVSRQEELAELKPLRENARILATILAGQIGAGLENAERVQRFTNILINSLGRLGKTFEQGEEILGRTFRNASGGRFTSGLRLIDETFPVPTGQREERLTRRLDEARENDNLRRADRLQAQLDHAREQRDKAQERFDKGTAFAVKSFQPILPGVDLAKIAALFQEQDFGQRALNRSRKATREAIPELFGKESFERGLIDFHAKLAETVRSAFVEGIGKAVLKPLLGDVLAPVLADIRKDTRRIRKQGPGENNENIDRLIADVTEGIALTTTVLTDPGLIAILTKLEEADRKLTEELRKSQITVALQQGRRAEAVALTLANLPPPGAGDQDAQIRQLILDRLEPLRQAVENFARLAEAARDFAENLRLRATPFITGELGASGQRRRERERAFARADRAGVGFSPGGFTLDLPRVNRDPETAFARFQEAATLYVDELIAGIEAGRRAGALKSTVRISAANLLGQRPGADQERIAAFRLARQESGTRLAGAGITFGDDGSLSIDVAKISRDVALASSLLEEYGQRRLDEMATELEALKAQQAFAEQIHRFFVGPGGILSQIDVLRSGKRGQERTLEQLVAENVGLRPAALAGDEDAIRQLQENYSQGLALAQSLFAPGSAELAHYLDLFEAGAKEFGEAFAPDPAFDSKIDELEGAIVTFRDNMIEAATAIEDATKNLPATLDTFVTAAEAAALQFESVFLAKRDEAQVALTAEFTRIVTALTPLGTTIPDILRDIGIALGVTKSPTEAKGAVRAAFDQANAVLARKDLTPEKKALGLHIPLLRIATDLDALNLDPGKHALALQLIDQLNTALSTIPPHIPTIIALFAGLEQLIPRAQGGPVSPGRKYLVGERGPELVTFPRAGMVLDHQRTAAILDLEAARAAREAGGTLAQVRQAAATVSTVHDLLADFADDVAPRRDVADFAQAIATRGGGSPQSVPLAGLQVVAPDSTTSGGSGTRATPAPTKSEQRIEVHLGGIEVRIDGSQSPDETARQVADAIRKRTVPQLVAEIRRAVGS